MAGGQGTPGLWGIVPQLARRVKTVMFVVLMCRHRAVYPARVQGVSRIEMRA